jgi:biotin transport system permease protein
MLGLHIPRRSPVHALPAGVKVLALPVSAAFVFATADPLVLAGALAAVVAGFALARLPVAAVATQLRPVLVMALLFLVVHGLLTDWHTGAVTVLRFLVLMLLATLASLTTPVSAMADALERGLERLRLPGVDPAKAGLAITLAIRFIPLVQDQMRLVQAAQKSRGRERSLFATAVPLIVRTLRLAHGLAEAIEARGYDPPPDATPGRNSEQDRLEQDRDREQD